MDSADQSVLAAAGLGDRKALARDAAGAGTALVVDVSPGEMLDRWAQARAAVDRTGRWPVLCMRHLAHDGSVFSRYYFEEGADGSGSDPPAVLARAGTIEVDARLAELARRPFFDDADSIGWLVEQQRSVTLAGYGDAPPAEDVHAAVAGPRAVPLELAVERYLYDWERAREPVEEPYLGVQEWFGSEDDPALVLLPAAQPWAVYAFVHALYDACVYGQDLLVAAARRWHGRYGAEPVAALDVMTWLNVSRPPTDPDDAWRLAVEHAVLAENTLVTPGVQLRRHARMLAGLHRWVLFSRP